VKAARPLEGRVVLVVGAGDRCAQAVALHLSARGASVVVAGPVLAPVVLTAGLVAAQGGTVRVVEEPAPPLHGRALVHAATQALAAVTDVVVSPDAFPSRTAALAEARDLAAGLALGAVATVVDVPTAGGERTAAERVVARFLEARAATVAGDSEALHPSFLG
jgi:hypothetical protein